jgi:hypothetical protein
MKRIVVFAVATVCLLGCKQELHDPLLRQQLTAMVASLSENDDSAAKKAQNDLNAILAVNSTKLTEVQKKKLSSAEMNLSFLGADIAQYRLEIAIGAIGHRTKGILDNNKYVATEISDLVSETKKLISEVAATL